MTVTNRQGLRAVASNGEMMSEEQMREKISEQLDAVVFAVAAIIFGYDAKIGVYQTLVREALKAHGITEDFFR